ncbi:uncharacterized protein LOC135163758 [Diachasmimorpha longicaudata]|uniref:uncharacterized protein LOC135163758 n=1 Tax=Diachasmimorpha longicaudata TaxID=58733 RepID=UPI0030B869A2
MLPPPSSAIILNDPFLSQAQIHPSPESTLYLLQPNLTNDDNINSTLFYAAKQSEFLDHANDNQIPSDYLRDPSLNTLRHFNNPSPGSSITSPLVGEMLDPTMIIDQQHADKNIYGKRSMCNEGDDSDPDSNSMNPPKQIHKSPPTTKTITSPCKNNPQQNHTSKPTQSTSQNNSPPSNNVAMESSTPTQTRTQHPFRPTIPDNLRSNRYPPQSRNQTFEVLFQADYSKPNANHLHAIHLARIIYKILKEAKLGTDRHETRKVGFSIIVPFFSAKQANTVMNHPSLATDNIIAYIPEFNLSRQGLIKNVPLDISNEDLMSDLQSSVPFLQVTRCNRFTKNPDGSRQMSQSTTILIKFEGQILPPMVSLYGFRLEVFPYISQVKRCSKCLRFGHSKKHCQGMATCNHCSETSHDSSSCSNLNKPPRCVNCKGPHPSTDEICPTLHIQRQTHQYAATNGITYAEARYILQNKKNDNPKNNHTQQPNPSINSFLPSLPLIFNNSTFPPLPHTTPSFTTQDRISQARTANLSQVVNSSPPPNSLPPSFSTPQSHQSFDNHNSALKPPLKPKKQRQPRQSISHPQQLPPPTHKHLLISPNGANYLNSFPSQNTVETTPTTHTNRPPLYKSSNKKPSDLQEIMFQIKSFLDIFLTKLADLVKTLGLTTHLNEISTLFDSIKVPTPPHPPIPQETLPTNSHQIIITPSSSSSSTLPSASPNSTQSFVNTSPIIQTSPIPTPI